MELQEWLRAAKKHSGMTLEEIGALVGRSKANVGHWMSGKHKPSFQQVLAISEATNYPAPIGISTPIHEVAHVVSYTTIEDPPITPWEVVVSLQKLPVIPTDLMVEVPDDALAARGLMKGERIWFKAQNSAEPRNVVLIEANGRRYIRRYTESGRAEALDSAFDSFEPGQFHVVAVMHMRPSKSI